MSETWFKCDETNIFNIDGYKSDHSCRTGRPGGGLSIYIRSPCLIMNSETISNSINAISIELMNFKGIDKLQVIGVYRPPESVNFNNTMTTIENLITRKNFRKVILGGDLNVNICDTNIDNCATAKGYVNTMKSLGMTVCNNIITRESTQSVIDHFFSSFTEQNTHSVDTIHCSFSDHNILVAKIVTAIVCDTEFVKRKTDYALLNQLLAERIATNLPNTNDVNAQCNSLIELIKRSMADSTTTKSVKKRNKKMCEWISNSPNILRLIHQKNNLWKKHKSNVRDRGSNEQTLQHIGEIEKKLTRLKKQAKEKFYAERFENCTNSKETWKIINEIISTGKKKEKKQICLELDSALIVNSAVSDMFAHHCSTIGQALASEIEVQAGDSVEVLRRVPWNEHNFFLRPASEEEILALIQALGAGKAAGIDQITSLVIKNCATVISPVLTKIINDCLSSGTYPEALKTARVVPVYKGGNMAQVSNYRPISVLPMLNTVFERVIYNRLTEFLTKHKILYEYQYGFRRKCSTHTALNEIVNMLQCGLNEKLKVTGVFMDLSKAFDCVNHDILLAKMEKMGIRGVPLSLFRSYLSNRLLVVNSNDTYSRPHEIDIRHWRAARQCHWPNPLPTLRKRHGSLESPRKTQTLRGRQFFILHEQSVHN